MEDSTALRALPSVGSLLLDPGVEPLIARHGRPLVTEAIRSALAHARAQIQAGAATRIELADITRELSRHTQRSLRPVINGTGVVLHTNLGRAVLAEAAKNAVLEVASGYSNLELDLASGERGERHAHVGPLLSELLGTEAAIALNNCAGAVLAMLAGLCRGKEVIVARGELVEIGGGFRVPEIMTESGCRLVEVGTTNKVYVRDYENALGPDTGAILVVHRSNFAIVGFTAQPTLVELAELAHRRGIPLLVDIGSGLLAEPGDLGEAAFLVTDEPRPKRALSEGADVVAFSGDKLLGGPQAGLLAGRRAAIEKIKRHPLARALRADKLTLAALEATLRLYRDGRAQEIPTLRDLAAPAEVVRVRAERIAAALRDRIKGLAVSVEPGTSVPGGGSLPLAELGSFLVVIGEPGAPGRALGAALRETTYPVMTRTHTDRVALDARTVKDEEVSVLAEMVENAVTRRNVEQEGP